MFAAANLVKIVFFDTKPYDIKFFQTEINHFNRTHTCQIEPVYIAENLSLSLLSQAIGAAAVCVFVNDVVDRPILDELKRLSIDTVALRCAGFDQVDYQYAKSLGIKVFRVPAYSPHSVAEHTLALLLAVNRKIHLAYNRTQNNNYSLQGLLGFDLYGKTIGIIGAGKIGAIVAEICKAFGLQVLLYDKYPNFDLASKLSAQYEDLDVLLQNSDIISLHCPLSPETYHLLNKQAFAKMKDGVIIINTARGGLIDNEALVEAIKSGKVKGAGLDVYEFEKDYFFKDLSNQVVQDPILAQLLLFNNVIVTSHQAFFTVEALTAIAQTTIANITKYKLENQLQNLVE
jgi:Lactate dehydrogenase and related dehydrogenases